MDIATAQPRPQVPTHSLQYIVSYGNQCKLRNASREPENKVGPKD